MQKDRLFEKTLFRRMFYSYIALILLCVLFYTATLIYENHIIQEERIERKTNLMMEEAERIIHERLIKAQNTVMELNYSAVLKKLYLNKISGMQVESYNYVDIKDEISKSKITSGLSIAGTMIFLNNDRNAYTSSGMINIGEKAFIMPDLEFPFYGIGTLEDLLGFDDSNRYSFQKEYFIYLDHYTYQNGTDIGMICILFDRDAMKKEVTNILMPGCGMEMALQGKKFLEAGQQQGQYYSMESEMIPGMSITLRLESTEALRGGNRVFVIILFLILMVSVLFIWMAYRFSRKNYRVIGDIERLVHTEETSQKSSARLTAEEESSSIIRNIERMIVENNGYQERMVNIIPYAKAGVLGGMLSGSISGDTVKVLKEEKYLNLIREYFIVTVVNFCYGEEYEDWDTIFGRMNHLFEKVCSFFTTEETRVLSYCQDSFNVFLIVNTDQSQLPDDFFYEIHKFLTVELEDLNCQITMGVDVARNDISELKDSYEGAVQALENIIIEGRGCVYFREEGEAGMTDHYFPRGFQDSLLKGLKNGEKEEIHLLLQKIYDKNNRLMGSSRMYYALVDELYVSISKCLKLFAEECMIHIHIKKYTGIATLEEIFNYYEAALFSILDSAPLENEDREIGQLEKEVLAFIDKNIGNVDLSMQMVLERFRISARQLENICRKYYDMTYLQALQKKRIEKAVMLLDTGKYTVGEICSMCGYVSQLTFRRNFKTVTKVNPSHYKKQNREESD